MPALLRSPRPVGRRSRDARTAAHRPWEGLVRCERPPVRRPRRRRLGSPRASFLRLMPRRGLCLRRVLTRSRHILRMLRGRCAHRWALRRRSAFAWAALADRAVPPHRTASTPRRVAPARLRRSYHTPPRVPDDGPPRDASRRVRTSSRCTRAWALVHRRAVRVPVFLVLSAIRPAGLSADLRAGGRRSLSASSDGPRAAG